MQIEIILVDGVTVFLPVATSLDASNVDGFKKQIHPHLDGSTLRMVIDMSTIEFVDSAGIGALVSCLRIAAQNRSQLVLCGLSRSVQALFELMRIHRVFEIHLDRASAIAG